MKKFLVLMVFITSFVSSLDTTHPTMKTLIQQPSKILTDFQGEDARYTNSTFPILISRNRVYKLRVIDENSFEVVR